MNEFLYIRDFKNEHIALFYLPIFPPQATPKLLEPLYRDIVYTVNLDTVPASYDIKDIKELLRLDEQSFDQKDYTIAELSTIFSSDFLDLIYLHIDIPPESPFEAIRVSVTTLNLSIIVDPTSTDYQNCDCDNGPNLGHKLSSQMRPLFNNPTLTQVLPPSQNCLVAHTVKRPNNPPSII